MSEILPEGCHGYGDMVALKRVEACSYSFGGHGVLHGVISEGGWAESRAGLPAGAVPYPTA